MKAFTHLEIKLIGKVAHIVLNRAEKANAINETLWFELEEAFQWVDEQDQIRCVVLAGEGRHFCAGIDFSLVQGLLAKVGGLPEGRKQEVLRQQILSFQHAFSRVEQCRKPVIAAIHGSCIGAGVDLISGCDMRYATTDAQFSIKEVDLGIVADVGSLQRLPYLIGEGMLRELAFSGRTFDGEEALKLGLLNRVYETQTALMEGVMELAQTIAAKSPLTLRGIKRVIEYGRDHSVADCLEYTATWNSAMLLSADTMEAFTALTEKRPPVFRD